jgi:3',5'-cyclic AMP phosphodiesterase CpdA
MRIIQISDTHLSVQHDHFRQNTDRIAQALAGEEADLIIHTGDLSMDGAVDPSDLELARAWNDKLPAEVLSVPGNHDVGDLPSNRPDQPVTDARLAAWRDIIGPDWWVRDQGGWRLIGLNAMLVGTGHDQEAAQTDWLVSVLSDERPIAIFLHKPLCIDALAEGPRGYWTLPPEPRAQLRQILAGKPIHLLGSGHLHIERQQRIDGIEHVWSPASSFVVGGMQEDLGGQRRLGYVEHIFEADRVVSRFIRPDGLEDLPLDPVHGEIYASTPKPNSG